MHLGTKSMRTSKHFFGAQKVEPNPKSPHYLSAGCGSRSPIPSNAHSLSNSPESAARNQARLQE